MRDPTPEQQSIIAFAKTRTDNLIVNALAGTGKTTTIEMICNAVQGIPILYLAFNKRIVDEASKRMPTHVECKTQNSLGHRVWGQACGRRLVVTNDKMRQILKNVIGELPKGRQGEAWEDFSDTLKWLQRAKRDGIIPETWYHKAPCNPIMDWKEFVSRYDEEPTALQKQLMRESMERSITAAYEGGVDYDDQIYMPVCFGGPWPKFPLVIIDEAQDLSPLNHEMLKKLAVKRLIAVGDPWQSIYAFRGAVTNGMTALKEHFNAETLPLSLTFRVPRLGVVRANERVPSYRAHDENPEGEIIHLGGWSASDIPAEAAILCRNNAPLLSLGFKLLRSNRAIRLVGMDIGAGLVRILRKLGPMDLKGAQLSAALNAWLKNALARSKAASAYDRFDCLVTLCAGRENLADAIRNAESIFKQEGPIQLLSIHKAKGLEWENVFHLDPWRIPSKFAMADSEEWEQELNCRYVAETRFKERLYLCNLEDWRDEC